MKDVLPSVLNYYMNTVSLVLLEILIVIAFSRLVGLLFRAIKQPLVIGEIMAGIMLGPSLFGKIFPITQAKLFPSSTAPILEVLAQIGLIFFMFLIGLELDPKYLKGKVRVAVFTSAAGIILPFVLAGGLALWLYPLGQGSQTSLLAFSLFLGSALSITAFPVLARIISESNLQNTPIGSLALTCAAVDDVAAWCLLALAIAVARTNNVYTALPHIALSLVYIFLMLTIGRWLLQGLAGYYNRSNRVSQILLAVVYMAVIVSALIAEEIGIHFIFGAFLIGASMPKNEGLVREIAQKTEDFVLIFLLPVFFVYSGLKTKIGLIDTPYLWLICGVILAVAVIGKYAGIYLTAKSLGLPPREASVLGWLMNTRGLTELIVLNIGLQLGVINDLLFAMLVIMALTTTFMTSPLVEWTYPKKLLRQQHLDVMAPVITPAIDYRVLVPVANPNTQKGLIELAAAIAHNPQEMSSVHPLSFIELEEDYLYQSSPAEVERLLTNRRQELQTLIGTIDPLSSQNTIQPIVQIGFDVAKKTADLVVLDRPDLVLLGWHRSAFSRDRLGGRVRQILATAATDVAVLVDDKPSGEGATERQYRKILLPYTANTHDDLALELALRLLFNNDQRSLHVLQLLPLSLTVSELSYEMNQSIADLPSDVRGRIRLETITSESLMGTVITESRDADLTIVGTSRNWGVQRNTLGRYTDELALHCNSPLLVARRHSQLTSHLSFLRHRVLA
jgi:Kef-type K+ transport system membrane component KefB/nucleotide-binding universal stress UspA family protein